MKSFLKRWQGMSPRVMVCHPYRVISLQSGKQGGAGAARPAVPSFLPGKEGKAVSCCRNGKCIYNPKWMTGVNFCVLPSCPFAGGKQRRKEEKKRRV